MQQFKLNIQNRENTGRSVCRRLRQEGRIPACVYSKGNSRSISLSAVEFRDLLRSFTGAALIELVDEQGETALTHIQEIQRDIIKRSVNHVDFHELATGEAFLSHVPVHLVGEGEAVGVRTRGGLIDHKIHTVEIRCLPSVLPDQIDVDVKNLDVGGAIHLGELPEIEGVEYMGVPSQIIVSCQAPLIEVASTEEAAEE